MSELKGESIMTDNIPSFRTGRKDAKEERQKRVAETICLLQEGLQSLRNSSEYQNYLKTMARFPSYSMKNTLLIFRQCPHATYVAGYRTWQKEFGRHVRKGEKGIRILAPFVMDEKKLKKEQTASKKEAVCADGVFPAKKEEKSEEEPKKERRTMIGYQTIHVFDISQTEGKPLPSVETALLSSDVEAYESLFEALCSLTTFRVQLEDLDPGTNGLTRYQTSTILIDRNLPQLQTIKTLLHEITHSRMHNPLLCSEEDMDRLQDKAVKETEAESTAFVVASYFGLDTSGFSFPYLVLWSEQLDGPLEKSLERIAAASSALIEGLEVQLKKRNHPLLHGILDPSQTSPSVCKSFP